MLTTEKIINHIKRTKFYCWTLFRLQNYNRALVMNYYGDDCSDGAKEDEKFEKSANRLREIVDDWDKDTTLFIIELKNGKTANGNGILGPFQFKNVEIVEQQPTEQQGISGLSSLAAPPQGFVSEAYLDGKIAELKADSAKQLGELMLNYEKQKFNAEKENTLKRLQEREREIDDLKKKYDSNTGAAADALFMAIKKVIAPFIGGAGAAEPQPTAAQLAAPQMSQEERQKTAATEQLANFLYTNCSTEQIKNIYNNLAQQKNEKVSNS